MNRSERARQAVLETELARVADAERKAIARLRAAGFGFTAIGQARSFLSRSREAARVQARHVEMVERFTERKTA